MNPRPDALKPIPRKTEVVWDDPKARITIVVTDTRDNRVYMAGPDTSDPKELKWFWFYLETDPQKKVYTPGPMPKCQESLRSTLRFARYLAGIKVL